MIKAILIDDEPLAREVVKEYLEDFKQIEVVAECNDGFEGMKAIMQHQPDLIFLDVQMPKINGFEMLELIDHPPAVIFATAFDEYAIKAFEAHAVDYLLKPFGKERFDKAVTKWLAQHQATESSRQTQHLLETVSREEAHNRVVVKSGSNIIIIPVNEIEYLEASDDYVKIHTAGGTYLKNKTMQFFEQTLPPGQFARIHRSYMVQVQQITRLDPYEKETYTAILKNGKKLPVSKTGYGKLKQLLGI
ncbi:response regulator transcription factor [Pedobacter sp. BS3]|uniref:LytR/AlgR family response regulator transcription factor n=1 Tax=Pedobacter sp. BS3 TaxID=2567937 RepID=UPI0011EBD6A3|nr:LytTR family DNA-binding domain-containing protein [Pedobacter sp. BS3]TZF82152.1 response regulator transcription factor [Pedobacter sp. BS3]